MSALAGTYRGRLEDGSIHTEYAKELSEFLVLIDLWFIPSVFPGNFEEMQRRYLFISEILDKMELYRFMIMKSPI